MNTAFVVFQGSQINNLAAIAAAFQARRQQRVLMIYMVPKEHGDRCRRASQEYNVPYYHVDQRGNILGSETFSDNTHEANCTLSYWLQSPFRFYSAVTVTRAVLISIMFLLGTLPYLLMSPRLALLSLKSMAEEFVASYLHIGRLYAILRTSDVRAIVVGEYNPGRACILWPILARLTRSKLILIHYGWPLQTRRLIAAYDTSPRRYNPVLRRMVHTLCPSFFASWKNRAVSFIPIERYFALLMLGKMVREPWRLDTTPFAAVFVDNQLAFDQHAQEGVNVSNLMIVDNPVLDEISEAFRSRKVSRPKPQPGITILTSPPQDYYPKHAGHGFSEYRDLLEFWVHTLADHQNAQVIVTLHPNVRAEFFQNIFIPENVVISLLGVKHHLPQADIYCSFLSTTVKWARAFGIPVIVYDCYRFTTDEFRGLDGVHYVNDRDTFKDCVSRIDDIIREGYQDQGDGGSQAAMHWGAIDGQNGARLSDTLATVICGLDRASETAGSGIDREERY